MATSAAAKQFLTDTDAPICRLDVKKHFESLASKEQLYAHYIARASWEGARPLSRTISEESPLLYEMCIDIFTDKTNSGSIPKIRDVAAFKFKAGVSEESWKFFLEYAAQSLNNLG